jgi:hypothetical protein
MAKTKTKATKREPSKAPASRRWRITLLKATPAKFIGYVRAPDAKAAIEMAIKDYKISDRLIDRLIATPEEVTARRRPRSGLSAQRQAGVVRSKRLEPPRVAPLAPHHDGKPLIMKTNQKGRISGEIDRGCAPRLGAAEEKFRQDSAQPRSLAPMIRKPRAK